MNKKKCNSTAIIIGLTILIILCILYEHPPKSVETFKKKIINKKKIKRCIGDECDPDKGSHKCVFKMNNAGKLVRTCKRKND